MTQDELREYHEELVVKEFQKRMGWSAEEFQKQFQKQKAASEGGKERGSKEGD